MSASAQNAAIEKARELLKNAKSLCVLTGAGISAESGLKTFRDTGGLWEDHPVEKVATPQGFAKDPRLVWKFYNERRNAADVAVPNAAHLALARLEVGHHHHTKMKPTATNGHGNGNGNGSGSHGPAPFTLLTQNVDGLHQQAGSRHVIELHGSIWKVKCTVCDFTSREFPIEVPLLPHCPECSKLLRPDIVWFGEELDSDVLDQAEAAVDDCDVFLVIGTSAIVHPAASFPAMAVQLGVPLIEINTESTPLTSTAEIHLKGKAGEILPKLI